MSDLEWLFDGSRYPVAPQGGRDIGAGHLRGWGLEFGELLETRIVRDPLYQEALQAASDRRTLLTAYKLANLYLIVRYGLQRIDGDIHEFGSFSGGSAVFMATLLKRLGRSAKVYAYDTFEGMPETDPVRDMHQRGDFADAGYAQLLEYVATTGLDTHLETVKGRFDQTLPAMLARVGPIALAHVDCDIYEAIRYTVRTCRPKMAGGAYLVFDDPLHGSCLGAFDAVQEVVIREWGWTAEQAYPHLVFRAPGVEAGSAGLR